MINSRLMNELVLLKSALKSLPKNIFVSTAKLGDKKETTNEQ